MGKPSEKRKRVRKKKLRQVTQTVQRSKEEYNFDFVLEALGSINSTVMVTDDDIVAERVNLLHPIFRHRNILNS